MSRQRMPRHGWVLAAMACWLTASPATAQPPIAATGTRLAPSPSYFLIFPAYYDGDFVEALKAFKAEGRGAIKTATSHWIDSICYHTMVGEVHYQLGQLDEALAHYHQALQLFLAFHDWMQRCQFPPGLQPSSRTQFDACPWGRKQRRAQMAHFQDKVLSQQGRVNNNDRFQQGGVFEPAILFPINPQEIARCIAVSLRRRAELMGPAAAHSPMTNELLAVLARGVAPAHHWTVAWSDCLLGLAYLNAGKLPQAKESLQRSLVTAGQFDHPLTGTALLELGKIALLEENFPAAATLLIEASYSAYESQDMGMPGLIGEAMHWGLVAHLMHAPGTMYPPLEPAIAWAKRKRLRHLHVSLLLLAAENMANLGNTKGASGALDVARGEMARQRDLAASRLGARFNWLLSLVRYQAGQVAAGDEALAAALKFQQAGSLWLFHIALADRLFTDQNLPARDAMDLYTTVLREPTAKDWTFLPLESLSVVSIPHPLAYEHWFEVAVLRKEHERALEITDLAKRHRFYSTLALGARLLSLRWVLEAPEAALTDTARLQRQKLRNGYPAYAQLSQQAAALRDQLQKLPLAPVDAQEKKQQAELLAELGRVSQAQDLLLRQMAVRREPASFVFPPQRSFQQIKESLGEDTALLAFFSTSRYVYAFYVDDKNYANWQAATPAAVHRVAAQFLRELGSADSSRALPLNELTNDTWKATGQRILSGLLKPARVTLPQPKHRELIVVPDGPLWYVPFEALQFDTGQGPPKTVIEHLRVRYAPTASLAVPDGLRRRQSAVSAVALGKLYPSVDPEAAQAQFARLAQAVPGSVALTAPLPAPSSVYGSLFDRLLVFQEILPEKGPYQWNPVGIDENNYPASLDAWMALPWRGPEEILLPGFRTAAENALKSPGDGSEIFLTVCGLLASGTRTVVLSRWRTGGQTSFDLAREFTQELPFTTASDAWQRAVLLTRNTPLDLALEPRVQRGNADEPPPASHPFFWAGYLLIDSGTRPEPPDRIKPPADVADQLGADR